MREYLPWVVIEENKRGEFVIARFASKIMAEDYVEYRKTVSYATYRLVEQP